MNIMLTLVCTFTSLNGMGTRAPNVLFYATLKKINEAKKTVLSQVVDQNTLTDKSINTSSNHNSLIFFLSSSLVHSINFLFSIALSLASTAWRFHSYRTGSLLFPP